MSIGTFKKERAATSLIKWGFPILDNKDIWAKTNSICISDVTYICETVQFFHQYNQFLTVRIISSVDLLIKIGSTEWMLRNRTHHRAKRKASCVLFGCRFDVNSPVFARPQGRADKLLSDFLQHYKFLLTQTIYFFIW